MKWGSELFYMRFHYYLDVYESVDPVGLLQKEYQLKAFCPNHNEA